MQRTLITLFLFAFILTGCAGSMTTTSLQENKFARTETYKVEDKPQGEIFVAINDWMARNIGDSKESIRYKDKEAGRISARIAMDVQCGGLAYPTILSNLVVNIKDNAYKVEIIPQSRTTQYGDVSNVPSQCEGDIKPVMDSWFDQIEDHVRRYDSDW